MAERTEARRRRADGRQQRRSSDAQPATDRDQTTGSTQSQAFAAARKAAGTAAAAALAGALAGGLKALVDRRQRSPEEPAPSHEEPEEGPEEEQEQQPEIAAEPEDEPVQGEQATANRSEQQPDEPQHGASSDDVGKMIESARSHLRDLLGEEPESVSGISSSNGTWTVALELVEVHRIPETTDVLASYEVVLDDDGDLVRLERRRRYFRSQIEEGP
jgi:Gas vesicle synthesis protein GvpO